MTDETIEDKKPAKDQSTIGFPYLDLDDAIIVARAIHDAGGVPLDRDQLAAQMKQKPGSGNFSIKLGAGRWFGLIENAQGKYQLTALGHEILDPTRERRSKVSAFLSVPLYKRAYEEWKGKTMPPRPYGLENAFVQFGVAPKQKDKARHAFDRSARSAGFFPNGQEDRLVMPVVGVDLPTTDMSWGEVVAAPTGPSSVQPARQTGLHPFIQGLLDELPEKGTEWGPDGQAAWLQAAAAAFRMIYRRPDGALGELSVTVVGGPQTKLAF